MPQGKKKVRKAKKGRKKIRPRPKKRLRAVRKRRRVRARRGASGTQRSVAKTTFVCPIDGTIANLLTLGQDGRWLCEHGSHNG